MEGYIASCDLGGKGGWGVIRRNPEGQDSLLQRGFLTVFLFKEKHITPSREYWEGSALRGGMTVGYKGISGWLEIQD